MAENTTPFAEENRAFALSILDRIEGNTGLEIRHLFEGELSAQQIRAQVRKSVVSYVERQLAAERPTDGWPEAGKAVDVQAALFGASGINVAPNVAVTEKLYREIREYRGGQIDAYIRRVTDGLSLLKENMSPGQAAGIIIGSGLASFGVAMIGGTFAALQGGAALLTAVTAGVAAMGSMTVVVGVALVVAAELLLFFLVLNKKVFLGMVFNNTGLSLVVRDWRAGTGGARRGDLFMNTGSMTSFMEMHETHRLDSPLVQVVARDRIAPGDPDNLVSAGIFFAEKNFGLYGTEGVMLLGSHAAPSIRFALVFACPYTYDNGVNVAIGPADSASNYFNRLYKQRGVERQTGGQGYRFLARVGFPRGGEACGLAFLDSDT
jgi:hypothetical protein